MTVFTETKEQINPRDVQRSIAANDEYIRYIVERTEHAFSVYEKKIEALTARVKELEEANV